MRLRGWWVVVSLTLVAVGLARVGRLEVEGESMLPTLAPGDRVLVVRTRRPRVGDIVLLDDPRDGRRIVKRVVEVRPGEMFVEGDNRTHSTDSRSFGWVSMDRMHGRVLWRYAPSERVGFLGVSID